MIKYYNKKGNIGKEWMFALALIFGISIIYLLFNTIFNTHLAPAFIDALPDTTVGQDAEDGILFWLYMWKFIPYLLLGGILIYMLLLSIRKEPVERQW